MIFVFLTKIFSICLISILFPYSKVYSGVDAKLKNSFKRPRNIPYPDDNKFSKPRELLGKTLFFDPRLSGSDWISCATCHNPALSWGDGLPTGKGHGMKTLGRRTPTILNLAWGEPLMWDGRAETLEEQALGPIEASVEMNLPLEKLILKIKSIKSYKPLFESAYPGEGISKDTIGKAIATFERTIVSEKAPFDLWIEGDEKAISESAKNGFILFNGKANCAVCHSGWRFTDDGFHDIGIKGSDKGRGVILDEASLNYTFKTPTLRNVDHRMPYMHDGSEQSLEDVVDLYNKGGRIRRPTISDEIRKLNLTSSEQHDLVSFLKTLTSKDKPTYLPVLPR